MVSESADYLYVDSWVVGSTPPLPTTTTPEEPQFIIAMGQQPNDRNWALDVLAFVAATLGAYVAGAFMALAFRACFGYLCYKCKHRSEKKKVKKNHSTYFFHSILVLIIL